MTLMTPWLERILAEPQFVSGGMVHRDIESIDANGGADLFLNEYATRGHHIIQVGNEWYVSKHGSCIRIMC